MTGFPGFDKWIDKYTEDTLWDYMTTELKTGSMMAVGTYDASFTYSDGILNNHAYAVLDAYTLSNGVRLLKISNPWGRDVYTGDWSDTSSKWTDDFKKEVSYIN